MSDSAATETTERRTGAVVFAVHAAVFAALVAWSWRKWPDPIVDFGRELYVPWQIDQGKLLYRDIASLFGPLSPYVNALWFRLFGVSLMTLVACNLAIAAATFAGIYHLLRIATDRIAASAATLAALLLCGFSQYLDVGNYNFATPYSHEATHGMALSVASIVALQHAIADRRRRLFAASGFCAGLVFLTKPEVSLAVAVAVAAGAAAAMSLGPGDRRSLIPGAALFAAGAILGPAAFAAAFHVLGRMPLGEAVHAAANGWTTAASTSIARNAFYLRVTGFDHPWTNAGRMIWIGAGTLLVAGAAIGLTRARPRSRPGQLAVLALQAAFVILAGFGFVAFEVTRALPLFALAALGIGVATFMRQRPDRAAAVSALPLVIWPVFALAMLAKMLLNAQVYHYGFYLALPAVTCVVVLLVALVPRLFHGHPRFEELRVRAMMLALVAVAIDPDLALANLTYREKVLPVGSGADRFLASKVPAIWQGPAVREAVEWIDANAPREATLVVLPEGVMINYLSRRETPVRYVNFMPPELIAFGEASILESLQQRPPDFVLLAHRNTKEYGYSAFGADPAYGRDLLTWVERHYSVAHTIGHEPLALSGYGIEIRRRKP